MAHLLFSCAYSYYIEKTMLRGRYRNRTVRLWASRAPYTTPRAPLLIIQFAIARVNWYTLMATSQG